MNLVVVGCNFRTAPVALRERLAFDDAKTDRALDELVARYDCEAVIISTCNRVELFLARTPDRPTPDSEVIAEFLGDFHAISPKELRPHLTEQRDADAILHLFRVGASLDSLIVGEAQIAGQVKRAYEQAKRRSASGPFLNALFQQAFSVSKRVRSETGISHGHVSVSSVAVDYVREVFNRFDDKTVLVIGAGKMGSLTLRHLKNLRPQRILVANRNVEKAHAIATECGGVSVPWENLDDACCQADIILSTTGAPEPIMPRRRWDAILSRRSGGTVVVLDIAVPRDFDARIHDGDRTCLFNIDDLKSIRERTLAERIKHVSAAEAIIEQERRRFIKDWARRRNGPLIARLTQDCDDKRKVIVGDLLSRLNGRLTPEDHEAIEKAFHLLQNRFLHGPISAVHEAGTEGGGQLVDALRKLFGLND